MTAAPKKTALELFRAGYDTSEIAKYFGITEDLALARVSQARSADLGLPSPYPSKSTPWPAGQVAYAGR